MHDSTLIALAAITLASSADSKNDETTRSR